MKKSTLDDARLKDQPHDVMATKTQAGLKDNQEVKTLDDMYAMACGIGACKPSFAQKCGNMACFTATYSMTGIVTSALNIYINSQITTLERQFNFSSSVSGILMSCNDLGYLTTTLFMSFYTRRAHIPRALACSTFLYGISGIFCTVAFFGSRAEIPSPPSDSDGVQAARTAFTQICTNQSLSQNSTCQDQSSPHRPSSGVHISETWRNLAIAILAVGMIFQGVGKSPRQPFLGTYVDDNVPKTETTFYLGIMTGISIFGPALAFSLGGLFSSMYVTLEETNMSPRDPRWIGAWWVGFLIFGGVSIVTSVPLLFFPKRMLSQPELQTEAHWSRKDKTNKRKFWRDFLGFLRSMLRLLLNPVYLCLVVAGGVNLMGISGMIAFMPKYLETQYTITAAHANMLLGGLNILSASVGTMVGGCITSKLRLSRRNCLKMMIVCITISSVFMSMGILLGCDQPIIHGSKITDISEVAITSRCQPDCNCDSDRFFPICGSDFRNYYSPCHAGCTSMNQTTFMDCSCLSTNQTQTARAGLCSPDCHVLYPYMAVSFVSAFFTTLNIMPVFVVTIRCVKEEDKPLAIGFSAFSGTLLGWFPGPVVFGWLVDTACIVWKKTCTTYGACSLYDIELLRYRMHGLVLGLRSVTLVLYIVALLFAFFCKNMLAESNVDEIHVTSQNKDSVKDVELSGKQVLFTLQSNPSAKETHLL